MEDIVLFVTIAEIAGVFVGFTALIGVTRRTEIEAAQLGQLQAVVTIGLLVVVAALVPVGLDAYGVSGHALWVASSIAYLLLNWIASGLALRRPINRRLAAAQASASPVITAFFWLLEVAIHVALILAILGVNRDLDMAFYLTALVVHLFEAAFVLAQLVYAQVGKHQA